jgi:hypothetical protein
MSSKKLPSFRYSDKDRNWQELKVFLEIILWIKLVLFTVLKLYKAVGEETGNTTET